MPDIKFSCPSCQQHIQAEAGYAGMQINCPTCQGALLVPAAPPAPRVLMPSAASFTPPPPPPPPGPAVSASSTASGCPSCGNALPRGAVLCTNCGYNLVTKQRTVAGHVVAPGKPSTGQWETPWYKTPYPYVGLLLVTLGIFYLLGRENPAFMLALVGAGLLYSLGMHIVVAVAAFREGAGTGFLTLCVPFYALYFVFRVNDNDTLKLLYGIALIINLVIRFAVRD
jgi:DNA-directed RNA polymerase subunit RPC12/RpoP